MQGHLAVTGGRSELSPVWPPRWVEGAGVSEAPTEGGLDEAPVLGSASWPAGWIFVGEGPWRGSEPARGKEVALARLAVAARGQTSRRFGYRSLLLALAEALGPPAAHCPHARRHLRPGSRAAGSSGFDL